MANTPPPPREGLRKFRNLIYRNQSFDDFKKEYLHGENVLVEADFSNTAFRGVDLHNIGFADSNLTGSDFWLADLRRAAFMYTNLSECTFEEANLTGAHFDHCDLSKVNFKLANLAIGVIVDSNLCGADLKTVKLLQTTMAHNTFDKHTLLPDLLDEELLIKEYHWKKLT